MLDGRKGAEIVLNNIGEEPATYRISVEFRRMDQDGTLQDVPEPTAADKTAGDMIVYAPRRVTLAPHQPQAIRIAARPPQGLPDGEYRVHMLFRAIPPATPVVKASAAEPEKGLRFQLTPIYGVTIPVIVRLGNLEAKAGIANVQLDKKDGAPAVSPRPDAVRFPLDLRRGARAASAGVKDPIAIADAELPSIPRSGCVTSRSRSARSYKGAGRRSGHGPICRNLRRWVARHRRDAGGSALGEDPSRGTSPCVAAVTWLRKAALLLALCAGAVGSIHAGPRARGERVESRSGRPVPP